MGYLERISRAFEQAPHLCVTPSSRIVIMSDCHRGVGNANDNFLKNEILFTTALKTYYQNNYIYIELGDGDELWENRNIHAIRYIHEHVFCILEQYKKAGRLYLIYGNHDIVKSRMSDTDGFDYYSGLLLEDSITKKELYLTHGHQADFFNSVLWRFTRFLVRYVWKPLEQIGVLDPTSAAANYRTRDKTEQRLLNWAVQNQHPLICGHTHRATTGSHTSPYFNSGCCIYPGSITALELERRCLTLVKWTLSTHDNRTLYVAREPMSPEIPIDNLL